MKLFGTTSRFGLLRFFAWLNNKDRKATRVIHWSQPSQRLQPVSHATTDLGSFGAPVLAALWMYPKRPRLAKRFVLLGTVGWTTGQLLKLILKRPRPYEQQDCKQHIPPPQGTSFPSGHALNAATYSGYMAAKTKGKRRVIWMLLPAWVGYTRIVLGVHYLSDILVGHAIGWIVGTVMAKHDKPELSRNSTKVNTDDENQ